MVSPAYDLYSARLLTLSLLLAERAYGSAASKVIDPCQADRQRDARRLTLIISLISPYLQQTSLADKHRQFKQAVHERKSSFSSSNDNNISGTPVGSIPCTSPGCGRVGLMLAMAYSRGRRVSSSSGRMASG